MRQLFLIFILNVLPCLGQEVTVTQDKKLVVIHAGNPIQLHCEWRGTTATYRVFWYQHKAGKGLELMAYSYSEDDRTVETKFINSWNITRSAATKSSINCTKPTSEESAVYFCAASVVAGNSGSKQDFGQGTIVSVLGVGEKIRAPKVSIYGPNKNELQDHEFISLVCVASNFFPEHVKIRWFVNNEERVNLYEPIPQIKSDNSSYSTSKRLTLTRSEYFNVDSTFRCQAAFLNGENATFAYVKGEEDCGISKESYTMLINEGKISYIMVLCKSGLYAVIILVLLWRKKMILSSY